MSHKVVLDPTAVARQETVLFSGASDVRLGVSLSALCGSVEAFANVCQHSGNGTEYLVTVNDQGCILVCLHMSCSPRGLLESFCHALCFRQLKAKFSGSALATGALALHQQTFPALETHLHALGWEMLVELGEDSYRADWNASPKVAPSVRKRPTKQTHHKT